MARTRSAAATLTAGMCWGVQGGVVMCEGDRCVGAALGAYLITDRKVMSIVQFRTLLSIFLCSQFPSPPHPPYCLPQRLHQALDQRSHHIQQPLLPGTGEREYSMGDLEGSTGDWWGSTGSRTACEEATAPYTMALLPSEPRSPAPFFLFPIPPSPLIRCLLSHTSPTPPQTSPYFTHLPTLFRA